MAVRATRRTVARRKDEEHVWTIGRTLTAYRREGGRTQRRGEQTGRRCTLRHHSGSGMAVRVARRTSRTCRDVKAFLP